MRAPSALFFILLEKTNERRLRRQTASGARRLHEYTREAFTRRAALSRALLYFVP